MWILLLIILAIALVYFMLLRPWLKTHPALAPAFAAEASFVQKLQARITGWKTKIAARLTVIAGLLVGFYDQLLPLVTGQDWTPLTAKIPAWSIPLGLVFLGWLFDQLRKVTANPPQLIVQKVDGQEAPVIVDVHQPAQA